LKEDEEFKNIFEHELGRMSREKSRKIPSHKIMGVMLTQMKSRLQ